MNKIIREDFQALIHDNDIDWEKFREKTVLITGAYGMLASYMIYVLIYLNEIYNMRIKIIAHCRNINKLYEKFEIKDFYSISRKALEISLEYYEKIDYIIHAASPASSQYYKNDFENIYSCNVLGTKHLLDYTKENKIDGFLFFSSGEVCGKVEKKFISENDYGYLNPLDIRSIYAETKRMGENLCKCYSELYNTPVKIIRPEHTYGPTMDLKNDNRVFAEFVKNIVNNKDIIIKSDGLAVRTFTYLSDAVDGFFRVLLEGNSGEAYNISNPNNKINIKDLAQILVNIFPKKNLKFIQGKRKDTNNYIENENKIQPSLSIEKIKNLGYNPKMDIKQGFKRTIESFIK